MLDENIKVLLAPVNMAGQAFALIEGLRERGIDVRQMQYSRHKFGYGQDILIEPGGRPRYQFQLEALKEMLEMDFDIYHFWFRSLFFGAYYRGFPGLDLPFIKARQKKIIHRFTGYDARLVSAEKKVNPYNAFNYGMKPIFDENEQRYYLDHLRCYVDKFLVQDIEMQSYFPEATIVPRSLNLDQWSYSGITNKSVPLVVHGPSKPVIKGTKFVLSAVEDLKREGLKFDFKLIQNMSHAEARSWIERADIAVDQLHVGWYGVFSMECMALGIPVLVYIRDDLFSRASPQIPVTNCNPDNIKSILRNVIKDFDYRKEMSIKARSYVETVHDVNIVSGDLSRIYQELNDDPHAPVNTTKDIDHMIDCFRRYDKELVLRYVGRNVRRIDSRILPHRIAGKVKKWFSNR